MASSINASTSAGVVTTADTTGNLSLQSNGTTIAALTSAGLAVTGAGSFTTTLGVTGVATLAAVNTSGSILAASGANYLFAGAAPVYIGGRSTTGDGYIGVNMKIGIGNYVVNGFAGQIIFGPTGAWDFNTAASGTAGNAVSDTSKMTISNAGAVTMPAQPAFLATSPGELNITGNGTLATLAFTTEVFDQGNNFASSTFTAPVTGKYALFASVTVAALATNHTEQNFQIVTSNRTYRGEYFTYASSCPFTGFSYKIAVLADMDAGDTAVVKLVISNGSLVVDVEAGDYSRFSGFLQS